MSKKNPCKVIDLSEDIKVGEWWDELAKAHHPAMAIWYIFNNKLIMSEKPPTKSTGGPSLRKRYVIQESISPPGSDKVFYKYRISDLPGAKYFVSTSGYDRSIINKKIIMNLLTKGFEKGIGEEVGVYKKSHARKIGKIVTIPKRGKFIHEIFTSVDQWDRVRSITTNSHVIRIGYIGTEFPAKEYGIQSVLHPLQEKNIVYGPCQFMKMFSKEDLEMLAQSKGDVFKIEEVMVGDDAFSFMPRKLPVVKIGKTSYFVDARLLELRDITNPHNHIEFKTSEGLQNYLKKKKASPVEQGIPANLEDQLKLVIGVTEEVNSEIAADDGNPIEPATIESNNFDVKMNKIIDFLLAAVRSWQIGLRDKTKNYLVDAKLNQNQAVKIYTDMFPEEQNKIKMEWPLIFDMLQTDVKKWKVEMAKRLLDEFRSWIIETLEEVSSLIPGDFVMVDNKGYGIVTKVIDDDCMVGFRDGMVFRFPKHLIKKVEQMEISAGCIEGLEEKYPGLTPAAELFDFVPAEEAVGQTSNDEQIAQIKLEIEQWKETKVTFEEKLTQANESKNVALSAAIQKNIQMITYNISSLEKKLQNLEAQKRKEAEFGKIITEITDVLEKNKEMIHGQYKQMVIKIDYPMKPENIRLVAYPFKPWTAVVLEGTFPDGVKRKIAFSSAAQAAGYMAGLYNHLHPDKPIDELPNEWWSNTIVFNKWLKTRLEDWKVIEVYRDEAKKKEVLTSYPIPAEPKIEPVARPYQK